MIQRVRRHVEEYLREAGRDDVDANRFFCLDDSKGPIRGCFLLAFGARSDTPLLVAKGTPPHRARRREGRTVYEIEFDNLSTLERIGMNDEGPSTPVPLAMLSDDELLVTLQSALPGRLLKNIPGPRRFSARRIGDTCDRVLSWWTGFQQRFGVERRTVSEETYRSDVLAPLERFRRRFVVDERDGRFLERRLIEERRLLGAELPYMAAHGDFCTANVMDDGGPLTVFDWEFPLRRELPLFDIFHFFASTRYPFRGLRGESSHFASFRAVYWGANDFNAALRRVVGRVCGEHGIAGELLGDLFLLSLIRIANLKFDALVEVWGVEDDPGPERAAGVWKAFGADKDVPFACIRDGVFENVRHVARNGFPPWFGEVG